MTLTYSWKLKSLKKTADGTVVQTHWEVTGTDEDGLSGTFSGATPFDLAEIDKENIIPYEKLTEELILSWIKPVVTGGYKEVVDRIILEQINREKNAIEEVTEDFPWSIPAKTDETQKD